MRVPLMHAWLHGCDPMAALSAKQTVTSASVLPRRGLPMRGFCQEGTIKAALGKMSIASLAMYQ